MTTFKSTVYKFSKRTSEIRTNNFHKFHVGDVYKVEGGYKWKGYGWDCTEVYATPEDAFKGFCMAAKAQKEAAKAEKLAQREIELEEAEQRRREEAQEEAKRNAPALRALTAGLKKIETEEQEEEVKAEAEAQAAEAEVQEILAEAEPEQPQAAPTVETPEIGIALLELKKLKNYTQFADWAAKYAQYYRLFRIKDGEAVDSHQPYKGDGTVVTLNLANGAVSRPFARVIHRYFELVQV